MLISKLQNFAKLFKKIKNIHIRITQEIRVDISTFNIYFTKSF